MKGTYYTPPNKTEEKKPASPTGAYYSPPNTTTTPTTKKTTTTPKPTTSTSTTQPSRTIEDVKNEINSMVSSGNIDYNKLSSLAGEFGSGAAGYIDSAIAGQSAGNTQAGLNEVYSADANYYPGTPATADEVYYAAPSFNPQQYIEELKAAQIRQQIAALDKAKSNSLSALADEEAGLKPQYYDAKNRAAAQSDVSDLNFAQYMASRGIQGSAGGANQMYSNAALQGQIGALDRQEQAARDRIARNRTGVENAYQSDVAAARAGAEAQALQAAIDQMNADKLFSLKEAALTGQYQGRPTMQGQQSQAEQLQRQASLLAAQYYDNIAGYINTLDPNDPIIPYLHVERRKKINTEAEKAAFAAAAKSEAEQQAWNNAFKLFQEVGRITSPEQAQILGLPQDATVADIDIARINAATSRMNAQTARKNAETAANKAQNTEISTDEKIAAITKEFSNGTPEAAYEELVKYASDYIADLGMSSYNQLLNYYKNLAGL